MSDQAEMFPETRSDASWAAVEASQAVLRPTDAPPPVLPQASRVPGWVLVGTRTGPVGYHRVQTASPNGSLLTCCGIVGRKVPDDAVVIPRCSVCAES